MYSSHLFYNSNVTTSNMKIGNYANSNGTNNLIEAVIDDRNVYKDFTSDLKYDLNKDEDIFYIMKNVNSDFEKDNYIIERQQFGITDINTDETQMIDYIIIRLKIGEFYTNTGYVIQAENGKVVKIIDNNIGYSRLKQLLEKKEQLDKKVLDKDKIAEL